MSASSSSRILMRSAMVSKVRARSPSSSARRVRSESSRLLNSPSCNALEAVRSRRTGLENRRATTVAMSTANTTPPKPTCNVCQAICTTGSRMVASGTMSTSFHFASGAVAQYARIARPPAVNASKPSARRAISFPDGRVESSAPGKSFLNMSVGSG